MPPDEDTPLTTGVSNNPSDAFEENDDSRKKGGTFGRCSKSNLVMALLLVAVLALYLGYPAKNSTTLLNRDPEASPVSRPQEQANVDASTDATSTTTMFRPFCVHYGSKGTRVKLLQTSMQNPSDQWSLLPCYRDETKRTGLFSKPTSQDSASFGAPDSIFQVDFSRRAFPQRETPILGFGGAFTEAASLNFHSLDKEGQEAVLELLFGKTGLGYSKGRIHMNSCDFSVESYNFDDTDGDFELKNFDTQVTHDVESGMVDMALRATSKLKGAWSSEDGLDGTLRLYASPWSPPSWMKSANRTELAMGYTHAQSMTGSTPPTCIKEGTGEKAPYAQAWALYFSKFLTACK